MSSNFFRFVGTTTGKGVTSDLKEACIPELGIARWARGDVREVLPHIGEVLRAYRPAFEEVKAEEAALAIDAQTWRGIEHLRPSPTPSTKPSPAKAAAPSSPSKASS